MDDGWAQLADQFADGAYASMKGRVRTYVMHRQLLEHLPPPPATVLDVGGGAGHQSFPLAQAGYDVTLLEPSSAMLDKARERLARLPEDARRRVTFVQADGERASAAVDGRRFGAVLCHGVLGYLDSPDAVIAQLCACVDTGGSGSTGSTGSTGGTGGTGGIVSVMTGNAGAMAVRPALEQRWDDALAAFDNREEIGVLGVPTRAHTVDEIGALLREGGVEPVQWYGVWHFVDWLELAGVPVDAGDSARVAAAAEVELAAGRRDPYRQLSRIFHLIGRSSPH